MFATWKGVIGWRMGLTAACNCGFARGTSLLLSGVAGALSGAISLFSFILAVPCADGEKATRTRVPGVVKVRRAPGFKMIRCL